MSELKPCPWCCVIPQLDEFLAWNNEIEARARCVSPKCPIMPRGMQVPSRELAIAAWNTRPIEAALTQERDDALAMVRKMEEQMRPLCEELGCLGGDEMAEFLVGKLTEALARVKLLEDALRDAEHLCKWLLQSDIAAADRERVIRENGINFAIALADAQKGAE